MLYAEAFIAFLQVAYLRDGMGVIRIDDAVFDVMALCTTHDEDLVAVDGVDLTAHQVNDVFSDELHLAAIPFSDRILFQQVVVFMVAIKEQDGDIPSIEFFKGTFLLVL